MDITIERLQEIELEREQTQSNPDFQQWMKELNISRAYVNPTGILNAHDIMIQYDYNKYKFNIK
jgi:hypothetical protein